MEPNPHNPPLIVILGPTAAGKSSLAMRLAERFGGEIIAADSRTIYRGMDIGTAKPTEKDRRLIPHHLIDIADPDEHFTVADFQAAARVAIQDISSRGKLAFLVGGSGLYIDALIYNFGLRKPGRPGERSELLRLSVSELQGRLISRAIPLPRDKDNPRHLIRSLETEGESPSKDSLRPNTMLLGLTREKGRLEFNIKKRVDKMVEDGLLSEAKRLSRTYGWDMPALQTPEYRAFHLYLDAAITLDEAKSLCARYELQYAKRQMTWFKRNRDILWISNSAEAVELITTFLNK